MTNVQHNWLCFTGAFNEKIVVRTLKYSTEFKKNYKQPYALFISSHMHFLYRKLVYNKLGLRW